MYAEDFGDGRAFAAAAAAAGKPVVLLTAGRGSASARSALSHTGALTTSADVVAAACRDAGVELVRTPREMTVALAALAGPMGTRGSAGPAGPGAGVRARGRRTAVFTDGGGHGAIAADAAEDAGLEVPELGGPTRDRLRTVLWEQSSVANPVDLAGMGEQRPLSYADTVGALLDADEVDAVLMTGYFGGYAASEGGLGGGPAGAPYSRRARPAPPRRSSPTWRPPPRSRWSSSRCTPGRRAAGCWPRPGCRCSPPRRTPPARSRR